MRKTLSKENRLRSAKEWIKTYPGKNIVKGYSAKYLVDKLCAVRELRLIGYAITEEYERQLKESIESLKHQRLLSKQKKEDQFKAASRYESDEYFSMILGYTSGGFPFGVEYDEK